MFGRGGGRELADREKVPLLAELPLDPNIREGGDRGVPAVLTEGSTGERFLQLAEAVLRSLAQVEAHSQAGPSIVNE
ncbi:MAG: P-loop NTPase [Bdellovibrionales bacterium]|nr:P-loop NTPase [Bdellovibrionales bacterium]